MKRLVVGDKLEFSAQSLLPDGSSQPFEVSGLIVGRHKGGFYGEVFEVADQSHGEIIMKSARPYGLIHRLGRLLNWNGRLFPSQISESAAAMDFVSQKIARYFVPAATGVYVPDVYATGFVPDYGQVQIIERLSGRPPKYDSGFGEYQLLMEKRAAISSLGFELGNVNWAGQAHPDNVFELENLWIGRDGGVQLVDQLPGIRHKGSFLGFRPRLLGFQMEIRDKLGGGEIAHNEIDTDRHRAALKNDARFAQLAEKEVAGFLDLYDQLSAEHQRQFEKSTLNQNLTALVSLGITKRRPLRAWEWIGLILRLAANEAGELLHELGSFIRESTPYRLVAEGEYRKIFFGGLALAEDGYRNGIFSEVEWQEAKSLIWGEKEGLSEDQRRKIRNYVSLWAIFIFSSQILNVLGLAVGASALLVYPGNPLLAATITVTIASVLPSVLRYLSCVPFTWITGQNSDIIRNIGPIPTLGSLAAVPAQMAANPELAESSGDIWALTVRGVVAKLSSILPWGGWGTDLEAKWLKALSTHEESIQRLFRLPPL